MSRTKILLTCGPRLCEVEDFLDCCQKGINEYRIHLGKSDRDNFKIIANLDKAQNFMKQKINIYIDLPTTRPRLGEILNSDKKATIVTKGKTFNIIFNTKNDWEQYTNKHEYNVSILNFEKQRRLIYKGARILLKDGNYSGVVNDINDYGMEVICTSDVKLANSESILFPDIDMEYEIFDDTVKNLLKRIKTKGIKINRFIISFCHDSKTIINAKKYLREFLGYPIFIMAKIEDVCGVSNFYEIAASADFIMVGRGDLAPVIGFDKLPIVQKQLIEKAKSVKKPVYIATQFLDEFAQKAHLCSPELNDIYLAIIQNAEGIMLSGEAGGSPNSRYCINILYKMINYYNSMEENMNNCKKRTQILATMGPTLQSIDEVSKMLQLGVHQFRIHMGLRDRDFCGYYRNVLKASKNLSKNINVLLDLPSTRPRVVNMNEHIYKINELAYIYDSQTTISESNKYFNIPLPNFMQLLYFINIGEHVMFRDGHVVFKIKQKLESSILVQCIKSDLCIKTGASSCFPESKIFFQPIDQIDIQYLRQMKSEGMCPNRVAISFASTVEQINIVHNVLDDIWPNNNIEIISKIESKLGLNNIDALIENSDGIMIARGDLLLCINPFEMPKIQSDLAQKCTRAKKTLIIATEFFERYAETGIVNRAELSDVALAVRQGADSIMLARETGNSRYCFGCVELIGSIIDNEIK